MPQINDAIHAELGPGQLNDLLITYYNAFDGLPATIDQFNDAEFEFLSFHSGLKSTNSDMWFNFLSTAPQSLTGTVDDMKLAWWVAGAPLTP